MRNYEQSSKQLASLAGKALRDPKASDREKALAASVLTQAADKKPKTLKMPKAGQMVLHRRFRYTAHVTNTASKTGLIEVLSDDDVSLWEDRIGKFHREWLIV